MKLTAITARNLKGQSFTIALTPITFIIGPNYAGKSARLDAIRLLLLGYLSELGKLPRSTFTLASGRDMEVSGEFDDGTKIRRRWFIKGDVVKTEEELPPELFNESDTAILTAMLNAETYFALSERERAAYVAANVPSTNADMAPDAIRTELKGALSGIERLPDQEDPLPTFMSAFDGKIAEITVGIEQNAQAYVGAGIEAAAVILKDAKDHTIRMEKTAQGLSGLRAADAPAVSAGVTDAKIKAVQGEIEALQQTRATHLAAADGARANRARRQLLTAEVSGKGALEEMAERLQMGLDSKTHDLVAIPDVTEVQVKDAARQDRDITAAIIRLDLEVKQVEASIQSNERDLAGFGAQTACPYCKATGEGWKAPKTTEITSVIAGLKVKLVQLKDHRGKVIADASNIRRRALEADGAFVSRARLSREVAEAQQSLTTTQGKIEALAAKADELARIPVDDPALQKALADAEALLAAKKEEMRILDTGRRAALSRENDLKRLAEAEQQRDLGKKEQEIASAACTHLRGVQAKMVDETFVPLIETANRIFGRLLRSPIAYNANNGEIGSYIEGSWVSHRTFSGTEKALVYAAIQAALASRSRVKIMLLDELGRIHDSNIGPVIEAIKSAVEDGLVDQVAGIDVADRYSVATGKDCQLLEIG